MSGDIMAQDDFTDRLSDYLDDEDVSPAERRSIEAHLATCAGCRTTLAELRAVAMRAGSLPNTGPTADLWPGVMSRLDLSKARSNVRLFARAAAHRFSFTLPQLVAASLALMVLSGGLVWVSRLGLPQTSLPPSEAAKFPTEAIKQPPDEAPFVERVTPANFADSQYDQAIADLEKALADGRGRLDPETVRILEANLTAIDLAIEQSRKALRVDPSNVYLNNHFAESRQRKLALLRRASALAMAPDASGGS
jgi:tetratricopeptide (TPR) repeat protein